MAEKQSSPATDKDFSDFESPHEASVNRLVASLDRAYHRPWLMMWRSFLQGMMAAIGAFFGSIIIGILIVYVFQALGGISLFKPLIDNVSDSIVTQQQKVEGTSSTNQQ